MPDKYEKISHTLRSLRDQTLRLDEIYLGLPERSKRLKIPYPSVPREVSDLCKIVRCEDYGPITKILGGLLSEEHPDTIIITFDDDMIYPEDLVERLVAHARDYPDSAVGSSGMLLKFTCPACAITPNEDNALYRIPKFKVPKEGRKVDSIYGYSGALYRRKFFPKNGDLYDSFLKYSEMNRDTFMNDDIVISGYLSSVGVERRIFPDMPVVSFVLDGNGVRNRNTSEISYDINKFFRRMNGAIVSCKSVGMYQNTEDLGMSETIVGIVGIVLFSVLIILFLSYYLVNRK